MPMESAGGSQSNSDDGKRLRKTHNDLHQIEVTVSEKIRYGRGRPPKNRPKKVASIHYVLSARVVERPEQIQKKREEAGCFVLLSNIPSDGEKGQTGAELLRAYKDQHGIERNYAFIKDPLIVNDLFLKKPERIEVLAMIWLIALLVWNLIEHLLRKLIEESGTTLPGWENHPTTRPTTFMMSTKFIGLQVVKVRHMRRFAQPLTDVQLAYLSALNITQRDLLSP